LNDPAKENRNFYSDYAYPEDFAVFTLLKFTENMNVVTVGITLRLAFIRWHNDILKCPNFRYEHYRKN
jgi:hypothetical protein